MKLFKEWLANLSEAKKNKGSDSSPDEFLAAAKSKFGKDIWKVTQSQFLKIEAKRLKDLAYKDLLGRETQWTGKEHEVRQSKYLHKAAVEAALEMGKKVPLKVLADYPEFKQ